MAIFKRFNMFSKIDGPNSFFTPRATYLGRLCGKTAELPSFEGLPLTSATYARIGWDHMPQLHHGAAAKKRWESDNTTAAENIKAASIKISKNKAEEVYKRDKSCNAPRTIRGHPLFHADTPSAADTCIPSPAVLGRLSTLACGHSRTSPSLSPEAL